MAYQKKTWRDRISEHPWRRLLFDVESGDTRVVELERDEGEIHTAGDVLSAASLNDFEGRVAAGFLELDGGLQSQDGRLDALQDYAAEIAGAAAEHSGNLGNPHRVSAAQIGAASETALLAHEGNVANPHGVTAEQVGAVTPAQLEEHAGNQSNPHGITLDMLGGASDAQLTIHMANGENPHGVTPVQIGAATERALGDTNTLLGNTRLELAETQAELTDTATGLLAHTGSTGNPHGVTPAQIGAVDSASFTAAVQRLEEQIEEAGSGGASPPRLINMCPYAAKIMPGADLTQIRNLPGHASPATFSAVAATAGTGFAGYYSAAVAGIGSGLVRIQFTTRLERIMTGEQLPLTACFADMNTNPQDVVLRLVDADGAEVSDTATISALPAATINQAVLTINQTSANGPFYVQYEGQTDTRLMRAEHRIYLLQLYALRTADTLEVTLPRESYDPMQVGGDAFDANHHLLVAYATGSAARLASGDSVQQALAKLEARLDAL